MPWVRKGKTVYKRIDGRVVKKQTCSSIENAEAALRLLRAKEHNPDWKPTGKKAKKIKVTR